MKQLRFRTPTSEGYFLIQDDEKIIIPDEELIPEGEEILLPSGFEFENKKDDEDPGEPLLPYGENK